MSSQDHDRLEELFSAALGLTSEERRGQFLDEACGTDRELRTRLEDLLRSHVELGSFLEGSPVDASGEIDTDATVAIGGPTPTGEDRIGRYKILQEIGEGGFGTVYLAEQEEPVRRQVALKIIKLGMDTKQVIARFEAERQALALMDHPNIAQVFDAGATETGRPYFVMELVRGTTITEYCTKNSLSVPERLRLFLPICHAVQHAHQKGVIHRDLKPSNVLVTMREGLPVPKVIDFGIAKATSQRLTDKTLFTEMRQFIGTPEYMSPDQAEASGMDVDTRTDIYSLGVMLYELLTGVTPFEAKTLKAASYDELWRIIREVEPPKPSVRLSRITSERRASGTTEGEGRSPAGAVRHLRGDLDWIVMKALEKDRTRRYETAKDFADDVERHLNHEPVRAGPPGWAYSLAKFVRRHRVGVFAASVVIVAIVAGFSLAMVGLVNANRSREQLAIEAKAAKEARNDADLLRDLAEEQARKSETISTFLREMLAAVDPSRAQGREVTVRFVLDEAAREIEEGRLSEQPLVEIEVRTTLGRTYRALGLYEDAETQLRRAWSLSTAILGAEDTGTLRTGGVLAGVLRIRGKLGEAEALLRRAAESQRRVLGDTHEDTLATLTELALTIQGPGREDEAERILREVHETWRRSGGKDDERTLRAMVHLGALYRRMGRLDDADRLLVESHDRCERILGETNPVTRDAIYHLGSLREDQGDPTGAERLYRRSYEIDRQILGRDHPESAITRNSLLRVLRRLGEVDAMRPLVADRIAGLERAATRDGATATDCHAYAWELIYCELPDCRDIAAALPFAQRAVELDGERDANYLETLAAAYVRNGDLDLAIATQERAIRQVRAGGPYDREQMTARLVEYKIQKGDLLGAASIGLRRVTSGIGEGLVPVGVPGQALISQSERQMQLGNYELAADALQMCIAERQKALPEGHWLIVEANSRLGEAMLGEGSFELAETKLLESHESLVADAQVPTEVLGASIERIVRLYESWNRPTRAREWRDRLPEPAEAPRTP